MIQKLISKILFISIISLCILGYAYDQNLNIVGGYEQGPASFVTTQNSKYKTENQLIFRQNISFKKEFKKKPQVILTIQSIVLLHGTDNDYQAKVDNITSEGFDIIVKIYEQESEFNIIFLFTAFEENNYLKVYYFNEVPTPKLSDQSYAAKSKIRDQEIQKIQIDDFKANSISCTAFLLGVKQASSHQDISISTYAQPLQNENKIDVTAKTWNSIMIESVSIVVIAWVVPQQFQGEWKGIQYDSQRNQYIDHQWTNTNKSDRYANLAFNVNLKNEKHNPYLKVYGVRGYDIREGPLALISKDFNLSTEEAVATAMVGTMGRSKLVAAWLNGVILVDIPIQASQGMSPIVISFIIAGSIVGTFAIFAIFYLKFFKTNDEIKHKKFSNKDFKSQRGSVNGQSSNGLYKNGVQDSVTLEFPNGSNNPSRKSSIGLLSKSVISNYKNTQRNSKIQKQTSVIVEMSEEQTSKNNANQILSFQQVLDNTKKLQLQQQQHQNQFRINEQESVKENDDQDDTDEQKYENNLGTLESDQQIDQQLSVKSNVQFSKSELMVNDTSRVINNKK